MPQQSIGIIFTLLTSVLYGLYAPAARGAYIGGANIVFVVLLTTFMRGALLFAWCLYKKIPTFINKQETLIALKCGFVQALSIVGNIGALMYLPAPVASMMLFTSTLMLLFFMIWRGEMESNKWLFVATLTTLAGLTMVTDVWHARGQYHILGYGFAMLGAVATATRFYAFGKLTKYRPAIAVGAETFVMAFIFLALLLFYKAPIAPTTATGMGFAWLSAAGLAFGSFTMFWGIAKIGPFYFSLYNKLEPVLGAVFSVLLLGEILKPGQYIGMTIVIVSLVGYQIWDHRRKSAGQKG